MERDELTELRQKWTPPSELAGSGMREVTLSRSGILVMIAAAFFVLGGIAAGVVLARLSIHESMERAILQNEGKDAEAQIVKLWREKDKERSPRVTYEFQVDGRKYGRAARAPLIVWKGLSRNSPLPVRYLPSDPTRNQPRDWPEPGLPLFVAPLLGLMFSGVGILFLVLVRRQRTLLREGRPALGIVTRTSRTSHNQKIAHYEFAVLGGAIMKGRSGPKRKMPVIGDSLCVIYDRDNPRRNAPYPLEMVKIAPRG